MTSSGMRFRIARRRNEQVRNGERVVSEFCARTGLHVGAVRLLEPELAVTLEDRVNQRLREGMLDGSLDRARRQNVQLAVERVGRELATWPEERVCILFFARRDFPVALSRADAVRALPAAIEWDGDTVTICTEDGKRGVCCDVETEIVGNTLSIEVDVWK